MLSKPPDTHSRRRLAEEPQLQISPRTDGFDFLLLEPFKSKHGKIRFQGYAGGGRAGHVFKVRIDEKQYALKMFKFDHPELNVSRLKGTERKYVHDPFFIECRANGSLIQQGLSGHITPACYGWTDIPAAVEIHVAEKFYIHPLVWDRPASASNQKIRGILFEWIDGQPISQVPMSSDIADQARAKLKALHQSGIAHGDLAASNILVQVETEDPNSKVHLIDLSASITLPHIRFSPEELTKIQQKEIHGLEVGFALLSRISINRGLSFATISLDDIDAESQFIQHLWAPPQPTDWQSTALKPNSVP